MTLNFIVGLLVWLFLGIPIVGFLLRLITAPFRAERNAATRREADPKLASWLREGERP